VCFRTTSYPAFIIDGEWSLMKEKGKDKVRVKVKVDESD
jgi:hypothetical protein